jgi:hypothetical protein
MARTSNGGDNKPAKTPARRRSDKARQAAAAASDSLTTRALEGTSLGEVHHAPSPAEVQRRAYELYVQRGGTDGYDKDDWYEAERQLRQRH